jgi:hypothetical protein
LPQALPPKETVVTTDLLLYCVPMAQVAVHAVHLEKPDMVQSTGHWKVLQVLTALLAEQLVPPYPAGTTTLLVLVLEPVPQVLLQELNRDQAESTQLTGQVKLLHEAEEVKVEQVLPPAFVATITLRVLVLEPVPQVLLQLP